MVNAQRYFLQCILKCINPTLPQATYGKKDPQSALSPGTKRMVRGKPGFNFSSRKGIKTPFWTKIKSSCLKCWAADSERIWMRTSWTSGCTWKLSPKDGHWMLTIDIYISLVSLISSKYVYIYIYISVRVFGYINIYVYYVYLWWYMMTPLFSPDQWAYKRMHFGGAKTSWSSAMLPLHWVNHWKGFWTPPKDPKKN